MRTTSDFANGVVAWFTDNFNTKFFAGDKEHGGKVWRKPCLPHLREELIDAITYLAVVEDQMNRVKVLLGAAISTGCESDTYELVMEAYNILMTGNEQGDKEEELGNDPDNSMAYRSVNYEQ